MKLPKMSLFKRSGIGAASTCEAIGWRPDKIVQAGVGINHQEIDIFAEGWEIPPERIIGYEACPPIYQDIKKEFPGRICNVALSDESGEITILQKINHSDGSSIYPYIKEEKTKEFVVARERLDDIIPIGFCSSRFDVLLWVDVEGHELNVLKGAEEFIRSNVGVINIEMTPNPVGIGWCDTLEVHEWLMDHGFYRQWIHTHRIDDGQYDCVYVRKHIFKPEKSCCPFSVRKWEKDK